MSGARLPGAVCLVLEALEIDAGTRCLSASPTPGVTGSTVSKPKKARAERIYREHRGAVADPLGYQGKPVYLNQKSPPTPQCAELVKQLAKAPPTGDHGWRKGTPLTADNVAALEAGTPIATGWDEQNYYPNHSSGQHAGLFADAVVNANQAVVGFRIVEQYVGVAGNAIAVRTVYFDPVAAGKRDTYFYRGGDYATITW